MRNGHASSGQADDGDVRDEVARAYDRWAATYDADRNATRDLDAEVIRSSPVLVTGRDVLELGCGTGKNTLWLAEHAKSVVALDFSRGMLARARERVTAASVRFVRHDIRQRWPVPATSVDSVIGNLVLEHVESLAPIYAEAARVLRPSGHLLLCELHPDRQRRGSQARFTDPTSGATVHVTAHLHTVGEYVNNGVAAGLTLRHLGEWLESGAPPEAPPRLLSVLFKKTRRRIMLIGEEAIEQNTARSTRAARVLAPSDTPRVASRTRGQVAKLRRQSF